MENYLVTIDCRENSTTAILPGFTNTRGIYAAAVKKVCKGICAAAVTSGGDIDYICEEANALCVNEFPFYSYAWQTATREKDFKRKFGKNAKWASKFQFCLRDWHEKNLPKETPIVYRVWRDDENKTLEFHICDDVVVIKRFF